MIIAMTMTRRDQVQAVATVADITNKQAAVAIDAVAAVIKTGLLEDGKIAIAGLGTFHVRQRRPRRVMNPSTGVMMDLPASAVVKFKPTTQLRTSVEEHHG